MYAVEKISSYITRGVYTVSGPFHPFGGAVDIIVVQQQDGTFKSSPWYVRFGKFQGVLKTREKVVTICVNGVEAGFHMYLDHKGEAYFLKDCDSDEVGDFEMSPPSSGDELDEKIRSVRFNKVQSYNYDGGQKEPIVPFENGNGTIVSRTSSKHSRLLRLMFGSKSIKENDKGTNVERVSSLESAEIAADLLETKWLTDLPSNHTIIDNPLEKGDSVVDTINDEMVSSYEEGKDDNFMSGIVSRELFDEAAIPIPPMEATNSIGDDQNPCLGTDGSVKESVGSYDEKLGDNLRPDTVTEAHFEKIITQTSTSRTHEDVLEVYTLKTGDLGSSRKLVSESVMMEADEYGISSKGPIRENYTDGKQNSDSTADGKKSEAPEENYDDRKEVGSLSCVETSESSTVNFEVSTQTHNTSNILSGGDQDSEVTCKTIEHICELTSWTESEKATENENCVGCHNKDSELSRSKVFRDSQTHSPSNVAFQDTKTNGSNVDGIRTSCSPEPEIMYQERETIELSQINASKNEVNFVQNRFQVIEEGALEPICHIPLSNGVSFISNGGQESKSPQNGITGDKPCCQNMLNIVPEESRFSVSESLDEEQFQFSDIHSFSVKRINPEEKVSNVEAETDGRDVEEHETKCTVHEECFESVSDISGSRTCPVAILRNTVQAGEIVQSREREPSAKSLPIIRSQIHDLENSNLLHPLSCSLDLNSENYEHDLLKKEILSSSKLESESGSICSAQAAAKAVDLEETNGHGVGPINSTVELSLCKHLLFEGMGADAASRVFETNKVNLEKFSTLGSSVVKNDKLVVRIGSHYFPWDAAAPIILGMLCFGQEQIFEPKGMIAVDQDEKKFSGYPSVPSGGSWRLWPFSSKKSTTISTVRSVSESTIQENVDIAPMISQRLMGHDNAQRAKFTKKKVRSLTPTSEELSSLNLKEGRNVITFSFSTAMLGQQQVDAMMYLWKWNARIVISDVDGTITRSDVLGQFMPLVGKDWSQTGVAHLFSAIKENGYQFLFLSARAISQAYLTRQFLFNLKQDGKALPDGPVVISPDGLFPSLYREVIRRAPHEFKISCLEDIRSLFPSECNPFYAGFGNRDTDEISYLKVGIPKGKIFTINPKGEVAVNRRVDTKSYTKLHALVNRMFPPMSTAEQEDYNSWNYWKLPLPDIDI